MEKKDIRKLLARFIKINKIKVKYIIPFNLSFYIKTPFIDNAFFTNKWIELLFYKEYNLTILEEFKKFLDDNDIEYKEFEHYARKRHEIIKSNEDIFNYLCKYTTIDDIIDKAFWWEETIEGFGFWSDMNMKWKNYISDMIRKIHKKCK